MPDFHRLPIHERRHEGEARGAANVNETRLQFALSLRKIGFVVHRLTLLYHAPAAQLHPAVFPDDRPLGDDTRVHLPHLNLRLTEVDKCLTSPLLRARRTARDLGLDAEEDAALRDLDFGRWKGRALSDIQAAEPEAVAAWLVDPKTAPHGGESRAELQARVSGWLDTQAGARGHTLCVTHAAVIRAAVLHVLDAPADAFLRLDVEPLSLTDLSHDGRRWALRSLNVSRGAWD